MECFFASCAEEASLEAIGTYQGALGLDETVALVLCERHAHALQDGLVILETV
jgi:hypothetical protein